MPQKESKPSSIRMHPDDNVVVVANDGGLKAGTVFADGLAMLEDTPQAHKVATCDIAKGAPVIRYGVTVGIAVDSIPRGSWVQEKMLHNPPAPDLDVIATMQPKQYPPLEALEGYTFEGFRNEDGSVGTMNVLGITTTVNCVEGVVDYATKRIKEELLPKYPNVDAVVALNHAFGCGVAIDAPDTVVPIRTVRNLALNPNFGGAVLVVSLGCEKLQVNRLLDPDPSPFERHGSFVVTLQDEKYVGFESMVADIMALAEERLKFLNNRRRETCPVSELVVGMQCGGSDAFSGMTANPALGFAADLLARAGATVLFSEMSEVRDRVDLMAERAVDSKTIEDLAAVMKWNDDYLGRGGADRTANTTPGNKVGGLNNIAEKSMGTLVKSGTTPLMGIIKPGDKLPRNHEPGIYFSATPSNDFLCGTLQMAAGMNLHVFTTGRGTPYGLAAVPVIKVSTRNELYERWPDLIDVNASPIATGESTIEEKGWELFNLYIEVASGRKKTWAQHWGLNNSIAIFNPGPVT